MRTNSENGYQPWSPEKRASGAADPHPCWACKRLHRQWSSYCSGECFEVAEAQYQLEAMNGLRIRI